MGIVTKKVCMVSLSAYPSDPRVRREAEVLEENGIPVDIICLARNQERNTESFGIITVYRILKIAKKERLLSYLLFSFSFFVLAFFKLQRLYIQNRYDVIQFHNMPDYLVFLGIFQKIFGSKIVLDIHDLTPELFEEKWPEKKEGFLHKFIKFTEIISCMFSDEIITVTEECKKILISRGVSENKITLVLNTPPKKVFLFDTQRKFIQNKELKLFYHGTVAKRFGLHIAIGAVQILKRHLSDVKLYIYGKYDYEYKDELQYLIKNLDLEKDIYFGDFITPEEVYSILKQCDIAVVPYMETDYMHLSLSTKAFEYAAAGISIVCTRLKEMHNVFGDESLFFVNNLSEESLADAILEASSDPEKRKKFVLNANQALNCISGEIMRQRYLKLILKLFK